MKIAKVFIEKIMPIIGLIILSTVTFQSSYSQTKEDYLKTPEGFSYWLGALFYQSELCQISLPEKFIDYMARQANVTKSMISNELQPIFQEGYNDSKNGAEQEGKNVVCDRARFRLREINDRGFILN
jgi:hypothetical protein